MLCRRRRRRRRENENSKSIRAKSWLRDGRERREKEKKRVRDPTDGGRAIFWPRFKVAGIGAQIGKERSRGRGKHRVFTTRPRTTCKVSTRAETPYSRRTEVATVRTTDVLTWKKSRSKLRMTKHSRLTVAPDFMRCFLPHLSQ